MTWNIGMPNLGHTMEEGKVQEWLKRVGDPVRSGEVIAVVESDKASFDVESPADGVLLAIAVQPGVAVAVGATIGVVGQPGEVVEGAVPAAPASPAPVSVAAVGGGRARISPAARALAEQLGVDLAGIRGTGEDGLVTRDDVRAHAAGTRPGGPQPLSPMRRAIAEATQRSWCTIPHVPLRSRAEIDALQQRDLPLTAAVARACALALRQHGGFNGWLREGGFEAAEAADLAVAVSAGDGLMTAVVRGAEGKSVGVLQQEIQSAAQRARAGTLAGEQTVGGSFTISSLGRWGVDDFAPIIAAPQVAILGIGRVQRTAREAAGGGVRFVSELPLTLVFDHRANDGVAAAQLLAAIVAHLEQPARLEAA